MYQFNVPDMTCGHCVSTITKAVKSDDPKAKVEINLEQHLVKVESALSQDEIAQQIAEAGYTPTAVAA
jgi:copper chaperone